MHRPLPPPRETAPGRRCAQRFSSPSTETWGPVAGVSDPAERFAQDLAPAVQAARDSARLARGCCSLRITLYFTGGPPPRTRRPLCHYPIRAETRIPGQTRTRRAARRCGGACPPHRTRAALAERTGEDE